MRGHSTIDNKYIKYGMLDNISHCGCLIPTPTHSPRPPTPPPPPLAQADSPP